MPIFPMHFSETHLQVQEKLQCWSRGNGAVA